MKVLIFGASGSGTTTIGRALSKKTEFKHLDADDYYWKETDPPFEIKIARSERNKNLSYDFQLFDNVIISGSLVSWGAEWEGAFDLVVFVYLKNEIRMQRLIKREKKRYGDKLEQNPIYKLKSKAFIDWANKYEDPLFKGRSLSIHRQWLKKLNCSVFEIDGEDELERKVDLLLSKINCIKSENEN